MIDDLLEKTRKEGHGFVASVCVSAPTKFVETSLQAGTLDEDQVLKRIFDLYVDLVQAYNPRVEIELAALLASVPESRKYEAREMIRRVRKFPWTNRIHVLVERTLCV